jgi:hypothetical protein
MVKIPMPITDRRLSTSTKGALAEEHRQCPLRIAVAGVVGRDYLEATPYDAGGPLSATSSTTSFLFSQIRILEDYCCIPLMMTAPDSDDPPVLLRGAKSHSLSPPSASASASPSPDPFPSLSVPLRPSLATSLPPSYTYIKLSTETKNCRVCS